MSNEPKDWAAIWSNILQFAVVAGAVVIGCIALFAVSTLLGRLLFKILLVGVPVAFAAAVAAGRK